VTRYRYRRIYTFIVIVLLLSSHDDLPPPTDRHARPPIDLYLIYVSCFPLIYFRRQSRPNPSIPTSFPYAGRHGETHLESRRYPRANITNGNGTNLRRSFRNEEKRYAHHLVRGHRNTSYSFGNVRTVYVFALFNTPLKYNTQR